MKSTWLAVALIGITLKAQALGGLADVEVFDRDTGCALPTYRHHGEYWVAGRPGARYSIVIHNRRAERVLAVTAIDGVNVLSGETGAWGQSGYVFDPWQSYEIPGWRKSQSEVADFNFTAASDSYAARTGRPANVGVIGVALFLEKPSPPRPMANFLGRMNADAAQARSSGAPAAAAPAPATPAPMPQSPAKSAAESARAAPAYPTAKLGTGHGALEESVVHEVAFNRLSSTPNEIIRIRYDSFENLVAMGVVERHPTPWPLPNPFPDSGEQKYVPDPPGG
jgi:hypothetical protein